MGGGSKRVWQVLAVVVALAISAAWVLIDHPLEDPVVLTLGKGHGVHVTDALIIAPLIWAWRALTTARFPLRRARPRQCAK